MKHSEITALIKEITAAVKARQANAPAYTNYFYSEPFNLNDVDFTIRRFRNLLGAFKECGMPLKSGKIFIEDDDHNEELLAWQRDMDNWELVKTIQVSPGNPQAYQDLLKSIDERIARVAEREAKATSVGKTEEERAQEHVNQIAEWLKKNSSMPGGMTSYSEYTKQVKSQLVDMIRLIETYNFDIPSLDYSKWDLLKICAEIGAPNTWVKIGRLIVEDYVRERGLKADVWLRAYQNNPVGALAAVRVRVDSVDVNGMPVYGTSPNLLIKFSEYASELRGSMLNSNLNFMLGLGFDINDNSIQYLYSTITETELRQGKVYTIGVNISIEEFRYMIAMMDNEQNNAEDWFGIASVMLNLLENERKRLNDDNYSIINVLDSHCFQFVAAQGGYSSDKRKQHILDYRLGTGTFLIHADKLGVMESILKWTLAGNRIFNQEIQHWQAGSNDREAFGMYNNKEAWDNDKRGLRK